LSERLRIEQKVWKREIAVTLQKRRLKMKVSGAEVRWIKITTDIFENRKIKQIGMMPKGDAIINIWFRLLCLAGRINDAGAIYVTREIPYTAETLAGEMGKPVSTVRRALEVFRQFGMIEEAEGVLYIPSWSLHQNAQELEKIRMQNRLRQALYRDRQRDAKGKITLHNATEEEKEKEEKKEKETEEEYNKESTKEKLKAIYDSLVFEAGNNVS